MRIKQLSRLLFLIGAGTLTSVGATGCADEPGLAPQTDARGVVVVDRAVSGRQVSFALESPLAPSALAGLTPVLVAVGPDPVTDELVRRELPARASVTDDGFTLVLEVDEVLTAASGYHAELRAGEDDAIALGKLDVPAVVPRAAGFSVKSVTPKNGQGLFPTEPALKALVPRDQKYVRVTFQGGTIDCTDLRKRGRDGIRVYTVDSMDTQDMFMDPEEPKPSSWGYRGHVAAGAEGCDPATNTVEFTLPGRLQGGAEFRVSVRAKDTSGTVSPPFVGKFMTENPGLIVKVNQVDPSLDKDCEGVGWRDSSHCDLYVMLVSSWWGPNGNGGYAPATQSGQVPESGDWGNIHNDEIKYPAYAMMDTKKPVLDDVLLVFEARDHDNGDRAKNRLKIAGAVTKLVGAGLSAGTVTAPYGAVIAAAGQVMSTIADVMKNNEDDYLGRAKVTLERDKGWWGIKRKWSSTDPDWKYGHKLTLESDAHGEVYLRYTVQENPASWSEPIIVI